MKKTNLIIIIAAIVAALGVAGAVIGVVVSNKIVGVTISEENAPRVTYVQGQDLDLADAYLTVKKNSKTEKVALTAEGVIVTGYNKNTLGAQTVVLAYEGFEVELNVTVVARLSVNGYVEDYAVGGTFNKTAGTVTVANDDGTTFDVDMSSEEITVEGFDSSEEALPLSLTVKYEKEGASYSANFSVNIYAYDSVTFNLENVKTEYYSHDTAIDLTGGTVTWEANAGQLSGTVNLTADMVLDGTFDLSAATASEPEVTQDVVLVYAGKSSVLPITITYSGVSVMQDAYAALKDIAWTEDSLVLAKSETEYYNFVGRNKGEIALNAIDTYFNMDDELKALVSNDVKNCVARAAAIYGRYKMLNAHITTPEIAESVRFKGEGILTVIVGSKANAEAFLNEVYETESVSDFFIYADFLREIEEEFGNVSVAGSTLSVELSIVYTEESLADAVEIFEYMLDLDEALSTVPANWSATAENDYYRAEVKVAEELILSHDYSAYGYDVLYRAVSSWREKNDYFDIMYTYYLNYEEEVEGVTQKAIYGVMNKTGSVIPFPSDIQNIYNNVIEGYSHADLFANGENPALVDTINFMLSHDKALKGIEAIYAGDNQFYKDILDVCNFDQFVNTSLVIKEGGYYDIMGAALENANVLNLWDMLLDINSALLEQVPEEEIYDDIADMFEQFVFLNPVDQYAFVSTLNYLYPLYCQNYNVFSIMVDEKGSVSVWNNFSYYIVVYYHSIAFKDNVALQDLFIKLYESLEGYYLACLNGEYDDFIYNFEDYVKSGYEGLSTENAALFNDELGNVYNLYYERYTSLKNGESYAFEGSWKDVADSIATYAIEAITIADEILTDMNESTAEEFSAVVTQHIKSGKFALMSAAYERAKFFENMILTSGDADLINGYALTLYYEGEVSLQTLVYDATTYFNEILTSLNVISKKESGEEVVILYEYYKSANVGSFLSLSYPVIKNAYVGEAVVAITADEYLSITKAFVELTDAQQGAYNTIGAYAMYLKGIKAYISALENTDGLISVLNAYEAYYSNENEEEKDAKKQAFVQAFEALDEAYLTSVEAAHGYLVDFFESVYEGFTSEEEGA